MLMWRHPVCIDVLYHLQLMAVWHNWHCLSGWWRRRWVL